MEQDLILVEKISKEIYEPLKMVINSRFNNFQIDDSTLQQAITCFALAFSLLVRNNKEVRK